MEPGTPPSYLLGILAFSGLIALLFGAVGLSIGMVAHEIGYAVDPLQWGGNAAVTFGVLAFTGSSIVGWRDYHSEVDYGNRPTK